MTYNTLGFSSNGMTLDKKYVSLGQVGLGGPSQLWSWGYNNYGQLGQGNTTSYSSPVQVGSLTNWNLVAGGVYHTLATQKY